MIHIIQRDNLFLLFDDTRGKTYRIASTNLRDAKASLPRASFASEGDWLDNEALTRALELIRPKAITTDREAPRAFRPQPMDL